MKIQMQCECGAKLAVDAAHPGRRGLCPYCKKRIAIPPLLEEIFEAELAPKPELDFTFAELEKDFLDPPNRRPAQSTVVYPAPSGRNASGRKSTLKSSKCNKLQSRLELAQSLAASSA